MFDDIAQEQPREIRLGLAAVGLWAAGLLPSLLFFVISPFGQGDSGLIEFWALGSLAPTVSALGCVVGLAFSVAAFTRPRENRTLAFTGLALNIITIVMLKRAFLFAARLS